MQHDGGRANDSTLPAIMPMIISMWKRMTIAFLSAVATIAALGAGTASAAPAVTGGATSVTQTSARLYGLINSTGIETLWSFQYGTTDSYGNRTQPAVIANPQGATAVSALVTGLRKGTTYHFRLVVLQGSYPATPSAGVDGTFKTQSGRPGPHAGRLVLRGSRRVTVRSGYASIPLSCTGARGSVCAGTISLTGRAKLGKQVLNVSCGAARFRLSSAVPKSVNVFIGKRCQSLLRATSSHSLGGSLGVTFTGSQGPLRSVITLVG
jgi:hypothetical protein